MSGKNSEARERLKYRFCLMDSQIMKNYDSELAFANSRSRLRMVTLYQIAQSNNGLVVGTGTGSMGVKAVGTNDYLLTADSSATGGVKWAENSAATKGFAVAMAVAL